ncbi:MAG: excinuclease ABC subunit UvrC [Planctomycetes bacterium]|jgi:excinuclease ABC subunit C|nr:excinuclease ABC subunit UvrC [Planctomycetota bacterium]
MDIKKLNIPRSPGCYFFKNAKGKTIYIGKAADLRSRVTSYWRKSANHNGAKQAMLGEIADVEWVETESEIEALLLEANLVKKHQPAYNVDLRDDKRFQYIMVSTGDEVPGVFTTRTIGAAGKYFGPYTSGLAVKETMKAIRRIWPYCTERRAGKKICFYAQIGRCIGVCGGQVSVKEYQEKVVKPIILFLAGKKNVLIKNYELRIKNLEREVRSLPAGKAGKKLSASAKATADKEVRSKKLENEVISNKLKVASSKREEREIKMLETNGCSSVQMKEKELADIKYQLLNLRNVLEHARILSIGEKYAADVVELAKILSLPRVPERIEGYDIANIFGREAVGSMVVFKNGEPDKNGYRKFKIKFGQGEANDVRMLAEVLERRFKHVSRIAHRASENEKKIDGTCDTRYAIRDTGNWPVPDLIIVDGGKAQLNTALRVLKKNKLDIPLLAVSKGEGLRSAQAPDKIFWPGEKKPLELPLASPALHIIKRVRDEAHRFAIGYHRLLRSKKIRSS